MNDVVTVYWPQGALLHEIQGSEQELNLWGFHTSEHVLCVVDIRSNEEVPMDGALTKVGTCKIKRSTIQQQNHKVSKDPRPHTSSLFIVVECDTHRGSQSDQIPRVISIINGSTACPTSLHCNLVMYDPLLVTRGYLRKGLPTLPTHSALRVPLAKVCQNSGVEVLTDTSSRFVHILNHPNNINLVMSRVIQSCGLSGIFFIMSSIGRGKY